MKRLCFFYLLFAAPSGFAQRPPFAVPAGYFLFPIRPGETNYLSGSFAELRPDHFHAGIDVKTQQREGLEVLASAEGYVSRIRVMRSGYGNAVYLTHPSGHVTVYGHLQAFGERLGTLVRERQYQAQAFELDWVPQPGQVPVRRGEVIGLSGNSGSSAGPHLHYEIRDDRGNVLDPQRFNFQEIRDDVPPVIQAVALRPLSASGRVQGRFERKSFLPQRIGSDPRYLLPDTIRASGPLGLELLAHDRANGTTNQNGLNCVEVRLDDVEVYGHAMESLPNEFSQDLNVHIDYATEQATGQRFQRLYRADGNTRLPIYRPLPAGGRLVLQPGKVHRVTVTIWDSFQNKAELRFLVLGEVPPTFGVPADSLLVAAPVPLRPTDRRPVELSQRIEENTLVLTARYLPPGETTATLLRGGKPRLLTPAYATETETVFLYDLRRGLPDSVRVADVVQPTYLLQTYFPGQPARLVAGATVLTFSDQTLYDTLYLTGRQRGPVLELGSPTIPLKSSVQIDIQPGTPVFLPPKTSVYRIDDGRERFLGGLWQPDGSIRFITRSWGNFTLLTDTIPPKIRLLRKSPEGFAFSIADERSGIRSFRAQVDSQWVLLNYDFKRNLVWSEKLDPSVPFSGELTLEVQDNSGNRATFRADFSTPVPAPKAPAIRRKRR